MKKRLVTYYSNVHPVMCICKEKSLKITVAQVGGISQSDALMTHNGITIVWNYAAFKKQQGKEAQANTNLFDEINEYWAQLQPAWQDMIFSVYLRIKDTFESTENTKMLTSTLVPLLEELYKLHPIDELDHWVKFRSGIRIPEKIGEKFVESDDLSNTRLKTYTKEDYHKLLVLALALRVVVPVWGELIAYTEKHKILGTNWKEYSAYQLLSRTALMDCEAMVKLRGYVNAFIPTDKSKRPYSAILAGVGSEDFPEWLLGVIIFRRVCIGDIRNNNPESHLVSSVHSYILNRLNPSESSFIGHVREKNNRKETDGDENKLSRLEGYKIRQELAEGDIAIIAHGARDPYRNAKIISPTIDLSLVEEALASTRALLNVHIQQPQLTLMQWVLEPAIKPRGLQYLSKPVFLDALAVAQAVLWHNEHYTAAGLVSACAETADAEFSEVGMGGHGRITKEYAEQLAIHYPYHLRPNSKQQKESGRVQNSAVLAIDMVTKQFDQFGWLLTLPSDKVRVLNPNTASKRFVLPPNIRSQLAKLAIAIATRSL